MTATRRARRTAAVAVAIALSSVAARALEPLPAQPDGVPWPTVAWPERAPGPDVDAQRLDAGLAAAFGVRGRSGGPETRAVVVVRRGAIVAERYASGFGRESRFQSWSLAKSVTHALVGILVRTRGLDVRAPADVPEWQTSGDPRHAITVEQLLRMTSGVDFPDDDDHFQRSFALDMTYGAGATDMAAFAARAALVHPPGTQWAYATASTTLVARAVGRAVGGGRDGMLAFMRRELFDPIGMRSAVPEFDAAGTFAGGMFVHATARDWARFGLLYLRDGVWDGARILPEGWVDFARTPAPAPGNGVYGAGFWLNGAPGPAPMQYQILPGGPPSVFGGSGIFGQLVVLVPTRDLVVVRLGHVGVMTYPQLKASLLAIVDAFPERGA